MSEIQFTGEIKYGKTLLENICEQIRMAKEEQFCRKIYNTKQSTPFIGATAPHGRG